MFFFGRCGRRALCRISVFYMQHIKRKTMNKKIAPLCLIALLFASCGYGKDVWTPLFNGRNLDNWEKFIGPPFEGHEDLAATAVPDSVFSVVDLDGQKVIRISGEVFGSLATKGTYRNFHARVVMKWGSKITRELNCGLLYYGHGPFGAGFGTWKSSVECQMRHGNMGALYMIGEDIALDAETERHGTNYTYKAGAECVKFGKAEERRMILGASDAENKIGQWNTIEIYCVGQRSVHVVNGKVTMRTSGISASEGGKEIPLTGGCLQLQSEGAELFVKSVEIQPIKEIPAELAK